MNSTESNTSNRLFEDYKSGAEFSKDGCYRYKLWRVWNNLLPIAMVIGLNPSTANADKNDPTINNLIKILSKHSYGGFYMMNCFPIISPHPEIVKIYLEDNTGNTDIEQWKNDRYLESVFNHECNEVIFAWGNFKIVKKSGRENELIEMFPDAKCFGKNKNGSPCHPQGFAYSGKINEVQIIKFNI